MSGIHWSIRVGPLVRFLTARDVRCQASDRLEGWVGVIRMVDVRGFGVNGNMNDLFIA